MKYFVLSSLLMASMIAACQPSASDNDVDVVVETETVEATNAVPLDGAIHVRLQTPVAEPRACILPIRVENGLDVDVNITMIGFSVTGPGDDTKGNMFAPMAAAGTFSEARVILEGQSCDAFDTLSVPEVLCKAADEDCSSKVEFNDGGGLHFSQAG